jgi:ABC-type lipoprotein release transport system permease subunit
MKDELYQLRWYDPAGLILAILVVGVCSLDAELIPARRAALLDPMKALRTE